MNVKSGARMCMQYIICVCVFISYVASRARAMPCACVCAVRESHVGTHVVVSRRARFSLDCRLDYTTKARLAMDATKPSESSQYREERLRRRKERERTRRADETAEQRER